MSNDATRGDIPPEDGITFVNEASGEQITFPTLQGTCGPKVIDIRRLYGATNMFTYDPGFTATGSCESKITFIDGEAGVLLHRGYPIEELAAHSDFMEVCYLLLYGELPTNAQKDKFVHAITHHTMVHEQLHKFIDGFRRDAHPMAIMCGVVGALSAFYHDSTDISDPYQRMVASYRMIAKMPTIAAWAFKYSLGQPFIYPRNNLNYAENFIHMMFATPAEDYEISPVVAQGARPHPDSPCRSRTERLDLHGAPRRVERRQPVCLYRRRNRELVGARAWRRQ